MPGKLVAVLGMFDERHREMIRRAAEKHGYEATIVDRDRDALPYLSDAEIVFGQGAALAANSPRLKWLCTPSAGIDHLGREAFASPDAVLSNSSGAYGTAIAEHTVMVILETLRRAAEYGEIVRRREWRRGLAVRSIRGSRITVLGTGDVGTETALRLRAFLPESVSGFNRSGADPGGVFDRILDGDGLDGELPLTDILIVTLPGTKETRRLMDARRLSLLKDRAVVVNVGRGSVIEQRALEGELRAGRLFAALDVFESEPLAADDPLWDCPNLIITPHMSGNMALPYTRDRIVELFLEDLENYCAGRKLKRRVDPDRGY